MSNDPFIDDLEEGAFESGEEAMGDMVLELIDKRMKKNRLEPDGCYEELRKLRLRVVKLMRE